MPKPNRTAITIMAILLSFAVCAFFAVSSVFGSGEQVPFLVGDANHEKLDLIDELIKAQIIPTVLDPFTPLLTIALTWPNATADYGNTINVSKTQDQPTLDFLDALPSLWNKDKDDDGKTPQLTLAMTDPDAPSRENPKWSEFCHWIATDVPLTKPKSNYDSRHEGHGHAETGKKGKGRKMKDIMPYKPPGPPPKTGKHRYVFVALAPKNMTTEKLHLSKPEERKHWGFEYERDGLRFWAEEHGLGVVGANFIYEQDDEQ